MKLKLLIIFYCYFHAVVGYSQSVKLTSVDPNCFNNNTLTSSTFDGGSPNRRIYTGTAANGLAVTIRWANNRWEVQAPSIPLVVYVNTSTSNPNAPNSGWIDNNTTACGNLTAVTVVALPIELISFDVQNTEGSKNQLTWTTASEKNNSHFDIERSTDGTTFHNIGQVKGNNKPSSYQYVDAAPFTTSYYRLKQVDFDGTTTYSKVVSVEQKGKGKGLTVYPTLVSNGILTIDTEGGQLRDYSVMNLLGQQVLVGKTTKQIDVSALAKGTYMLKVGSDVAKFVKQ